MGAVLVATKKAKKGGGEMSDLISQTEAARMRGVTRPAIADLIERGRLRSVQIGGRRLVYRSEVESFTEAKRGPKGGRKGGQ
jgi:excisionase family DNA binding protein